MTDSALATALVAFQSEMPKVGKDKTADTGTYKYTYADLASLTDVATPILVRNGLSFSAKPRRCDDGSYELVGVLRHTSGEFDEGALPLFGRKAQELGSSITYSRRYLFGCMTGIVTEDDDDGARAQNAQGQTRRQERPTPTVLAQERVLAAWKAANGDSGVDPLPYIAADFAKRHDGADVTAATVPQLIAYAETLEAGK